MIVEICLEPLGLRDDPIAALQMMLRNEMKRIQANWDAMAYCWVVRGITLHRKIAVDRQVLQGAISIGENMKFVSFPRDITRK